MRLSLLKYFRHCKHLALPASPGVPLYYTSMSSLHNYPYVTDIHIIHHYTFLHRSDCNIRRRDYTPLLGHALDTLTHNYITITHETVIGATNVIGTTSGATTKL